MVKKIETKKDAVTKGVKNGRVGNREHNHKLCDAMAEGYIHCRIIHEDNQAQDWVFIAVNSAFEKMTGLKGVVGKRASEVMPDIRRTHPGLLETCLRVAQSGQAEKIEFFVETLQTWFFASVSSPEAGFFMAIFDVITGRKTAEAKLRERMEYFCTVANFTYDWEYWLDNHCRILYTSPSCERITGYNAAKFEEDPTLLEKIIHPQDRVAYAHHLREEIEKTEPIWLDFRIVTAVGETRWINHACQRVYDADGRSMGRRASNRDITQRRQMEQALRESESILNMSEEVAQTGSWRLDLRTKKAAWSDQMFRLFGAKREEFDGDMKRIIAERVHPDDAASVHEFNRTILTGISSVASLTFRIMLPDGTERTVRTHGKLVRDDSGQPLSMTGYMQEVSEWVRVKHQFQQMKRLYAALNQINHTILRAKDRADLYASTCDVIVLHGEFAAAWVELLDETSGELRPVAASGLDVKKWLLPIVNVNAESGQNGVILEAFQTASVAASEDVQSDERTKSLRLHLEKLDFRSLASIPFQLRGKTSGVISVASTEPGLFKTGEETSLLNEMGRDITLGLEKADPLRESEEKMRSIFRAAPTGIGVVKDRRLLDINDRICEITGYSKEELIGQSARALYPTQEEFDFVGREKYRQIAEKGTGQVETHWMKKDGSIIDVLLASTPIDIEDLSKGVTFTALDITDRKQAEKALRESEERFRMLFDKAPLGYQSLDADGMFIDVNQAWLDTMGYSREEVLGRWFGEFLSPGYVDAFRERFPLFKAAGQIHSEFEMLHKDGSKRWIAFDGRIGHELNGAFKQTHCILQDVTEQRKAEEALRESETALRALLNSVTESILLIKVDGTVAAANETATTRLNAQPAGMIGRNIYEFLPALVAERRRAEAEQVVASGNPARFEDERLGKWIDNSIYPVKDEAGRVTHLAIYGNDITERKRAEEALRQSEDKFKYFFDHSTVAKSITSVDNKLHANRAFCEMVGYSAEELENKPWREITHPGDAELNIREVDEILTGKKESARFIKRYIHKNGSNVWVDLSTSLRRDANGTPQYFVTTALDITERVKAEEELRKREVLLNKIFDVLPVGLWLADKNGKLTRSNRVGREIWGAEPLVGQEEYGVFKARRLPSGEEIAPEDWALAHTIREGTTILNEMLEIDGFDGRKKIILNYTAPVLDDTGRVDGAVIVNLDITEHMKAEKVLRESEDKFRKAFMTSPDSININRLQDGMYISINPGFTQIMGYTEADVIGKTSLDLHIWEDPQDRARLVEGLRKDGFVDNLEASFRRKDGGTKYGLMSASVIELGGIPHILSITRDITDRKQAEEAIRQSERQMKALLTSLDDIVFEFDKDGTYLNIWAADESLLVMPKAQMMGRNVLEVMGREQGSPFEDAVKRSLTGNIPQSIEYPLEVIGGKRWFMARVSPILSMDGTSRTVSVLVRDITERKRIEEQVQIQLQRVRALNEIDRAISASLDMRLSLDILLTHTLNQLHVDAACILLLNPSSQTLEYLTGRGFRSTAIRDSRVALGQGFPGRAGLERKTLHVPDIKTDEDKFIRKKVLIEEGVVEYACVPLIAKGLLKGVLEIFNRTHLNPDMEWVNYLETLGGQAAIAIDNAQLFEGMQRSNMDLIAAYDATIEGWSHAMDLRDKETEGHTVRVTEWTVKLAKAMGVSQQEITHMRRGALLHDIGKLGVPDHILHKAGELDRLEWAIMRQHPTYAFNMLIPIQYLRPALDIPYCHHEKWDGTGYPRGLKGEEIPLAARIFAVVDVWDALRSDRPYRQGWSIEKIRKHLQEESGRHFDPHVVTTFLRIIEEDE